MGYRIKYYIIVKDEKYDKDGYTLSLLDVDDGHLYAHEEGNDGLYTTALMSLLESIQFMFSETKLLNNPPPKRLFNNGTWIKLEDNLDYIQFEWLDDGSIKISACHQDSGKNIVFICNEYGISNVDNLPLDVTRFLLLSDKNTICQEIMKWVIWDNTSDDSRIMCTTKALKEKIESVVNCDEHLIEILVRISEPFFFMKQSSDEIEGISNVLKSIESDYNPSKEDTNCFGGNFFIINKDKSEEELQTMTINTINEDVIGVVVDRDLDDEIIPSSIKLFIRENGKETYYKYPEITPLDLFEQGLITEKSLVSLNNMVESIDQSSDETQKEFENQKHQIDEAGVEGEED